MSIRNSRPTILLPLFLSLVLITGIYIGIKLGKSGISQRLVIYPQADKVNAVLNLIDESYVDTINRERLEKEAIDKILESLDPHSVYIPAEDLQEVNEPLEGNFGGIGVFFNMQNDTIIIVNTIPNGPSERVGIKAGDRLIKVNDTIVAGVKLSSDAIVKRLKGLEGSKVDVAIKRNGYTELIKFSITRGVIPIYSVDAAYMIDKHTGYIKINKFAKTTHSEFVSAVKELKLKGLKKLIVDLRGNGGGFLDAANKIADEFLDDKKLIVYTQGRSRSRSNSYATKGGLCLNDSLVLLIDEYSASASEILAGAIQDNDRGIIIGRRSFGKGLVQEQSPLPGGAAIRLTIARYYTPTGRCIQKSYKNGSRDYYDELHKRFENGELEMADSIKFIDSLKFKTPAGNIVYGGGGIMPDIFVPLDTSYFSNFYFAIRNKGFIYNFAFQYSDNNRASLEKYKTYSELKEHLVQIHIFKEFLKFTEKEGLKAPEPEIKTSEKYIENQVIALIVRNFFDNKGYYPIINENDNTVNRAFQKLN